VHCSCLPKMRTLEIDSHEHASVIPQDEDEASGAEGSTLLGALHEVHMLPYRKIFMTSVASVFIACVVYACAGLHAPAHADQPSQDEPVSPLRFLQSDQLMEVVAHKWVEHNPQCHVTGSESLNVCHAGVFEPQLVSAMHAQLSSGRSMSPVMMSMLAALKMNVADRKRLASVAGHLFDPRIQELSEVAMGVINEHAKDGVKAVHRRMKEALASRNDDMQDLREKLLPGVPQIDDSSMWHPYVRAHHVGLRGVSKGWRMGFEMTLPKHGSTSHTTRRLKPKNNIAADVVATLDLPFAHIIVAAMHREGELTMPYWLKIVVTIEDLTNPLLLIIDCCLMWPKRTP